MAAVQDREIDIDLVSGLVGYHHAERDGYFRDGYFVVVIYERVT